MTPTERTRRLEDEERSQSLVQAEVEKEKEVREEALVIFEESGAYGCARVIVGENWRGGRIVENPLAIRRGQADRDIGLDLLVKSPARSSPGYYEGMGIVIRANVETGAVWVLSGKQPVGVLPDPESGWTGERREALENAVFAAYKKPGKYSWTKGQTEESWYLSRGIPIKG